MKNEETNTAKAVIKVLIKANNESEALTCTRDKVA